MQSGQRPAEASTRTGADGRFELRLGRTGNPPTILQAIYRDVAYTSGPHRFGSRGAFATEIVVHETTTDTRGLFVGDRAIVIEQNTPGAVEVREVLTIGNAGSKTVVGSAAAPAGARTTVRLPLPRGAAQIEVRQGMAPSGQDDDGALLDTIPVTPGVRQVILTYRIPAPSTSLEIRVPAGLSTLGMHVFAAAPLRAVSEQLPVREQRVVGTRSVQRLSGRNLAAETVVVARLSGVEVRGTPPAAHLAIGVLVISVIVLAAWPWLRRSAPQARSGIPSA
jgi:hypothetical protein